MNYYLYVILIFFFHKKLDPDLETVLPWFKENKTVTNTGKFLFVLLNKHSNCKIVINGTILHPTGQKHEFT